MAPLNSCSATPLIANMTKPKGGVTMPLAKEVESGESSSETVVLLDQNHNVKTAKNNEEKGVTEPEVEEPSTLQPKRPRVEELPVQQLKRPSPQDINTRTRKMIYSMFNKHLRTNLNVLVIGPRESGKSSLINSMSMALTQEWSDKARYCPGRNHVIDECVIYENEDGGKVVFSDTRGFEEIHDAEHAILILRYVLEGRIPAKCIPCVLLMDKGLIKKRYHRAYQPTRKIDCVLFVSAANDAPTARLMSIVQQAIATSKHSSVNRVPTLSVVTKSDLLSETDRRKMEESRGFLRHSFEHHLSAGHRDYMERPPKKVHNYHCELETFSDESADPTSVQSSMEKDTQLLAIWRDVISCTTEGNSDRRKRAYSNPSSRGTCGCLPFRFDYARLRSGSF